MPEDSKTPQVPAELFGTTWNQVFGELGGESERACAVVAGALLDDLLGRLLEAFLVEHADGRDDLFSSENVNAPLGGFGSRVVAAYAVGLLQPVEREALRKIKRIRNRFAHDLKLSFRDDQVSALCHQIAGLCPTENYGGGTRTARELFEATVANIAGRVRERLYLIETFGLKGSFTSVLTAGVGAGKRKDSAG